MLELIKAQCEEGDRYYKSLLAASDGKWRECVTDLHVTGMNIADVMSLRTRCLDCPETRWHIDSFFTFTRTLHGSTT
jgi:hypothetical protein